MQPHAKRKILIFDGDAVRLAVLAMLLEREGFDVMRADSGDAIGSDSLPTAWVPDVVMADLQLPGLRGTELADRISSRWPHATKIALSATPADCTDGYSRILRKPLPPENLRDLLFDESSEQDSSTWHNGKQGSDFDNGDASKVLDHEVFAKLEKRLPPEALELLYRTMLSDSRQRLDAIQAAFASGDRKTMRSEAQRLAGSARLTGAVHLRHASESIAIRHESTSSFRQQLRQLERELDRLSQTLAGKFS